MLCWEAHLSCRLTLQLRTEVLPPDCQCLASTPSSVPQNKYQQKILFCVSALRIRLEQNPIPSFILPQPTSFSTCFYILRLLIKSSSENQKIKAYSTSMLF